MRTIPKEIIQKTAECEENGPWGRHHKKGEYGKEKELREALKEKQKELRDELNVYDSDKRRVRGLVSEVKDLQGELIDLRVRSIMDTKEVLTEEQFGKFTAKMKKHKGQRGRRVNKKRRRW
jgi:Spy/CpxP family protein refolding chaperone